MEDGQRSIGDRIDEKCGKGEALHAGPARIATEATVQRAVASVS